jgi:hypothetical protein
MSRERVSRNDPCPCGSGKKYKKCCWKKNDQWAEDENGTIIREVPMSEDTADRLGDYLDSRRDAEGRELDPDELLFPNMHLEHAEHEMSQAMEQAGLDPAITYAFQKTGRIVSEDNIGLLTDAEVAEWNEAINEYYDREEPPRDEAEYPIGTVALYGPDDKVTTKIVAGVIANEGAEALIERWVGTDIKDNAKIQGAIRRFFDRHGVKSVAAVDRNMGCPHEEGEDFPVGKDCPFCPFWQGKQGSGADGSLF